MSPRRASEAEQIVTGLDIGTTKICSIIGQKDEKGQIRVLGMGSNPSTGLRKGIVVDFESTIDSIEKAVSKAEQIANHEVREVCVGITGGHMRSFNRRAAIEISNPMRGVDHSDIRRVHERAKTKGMPQGYEVINFFPVEYYCDDILIDNPEGRLCHKLEVICHIVTADVAAAQNLIRCIHMAGLKTSGILFECVASSQAALNDNERDLGVLLVDIGGGSSDLIIFQDQRIRHSACIPFGGDDITNDIHHALKISRFEAENVKKRAGCAYASKVDPDETLEINSVFENRRRKIKRRFLAEVIQARCQEILEQVWENVEESPVNPDEIAGVVLTGGTALLDQLPELAHRYFGRSVKVGAPQNIKGMSSIISSPIYATGIGLVMDGLSNPQNLRLTKRNLIQKIKALFQDFVDWYN